MRIKLEDTAALLIDFQERLFPHMQQKDELLQNTTRLIQGLNVLDIQMIVTQQYTKGLGSTIRELDEIFGDYTPFEKIAFSCCGAEDFIKRLKQLKKEIIIVAGIEAHVCVLQTVLDLIHEKFIPVVVEDCISSRKLNDKNIAVERIRSSGVIITTYESILFELVGVAGTQTFKAVSKIVK